MSLWSISCKLQVGLSLWEGRWEHAAPLVPGALQGLWVLPANPFLAVTLQHGHLPLISLSWPFSPISGQASCSSTSRPL